MNAGYNYGETTEIFTTRYKVAKANLPAGTYRNVVGNYALSMGLAACLLYTSPSPRDGLLSRMPSSA